MIEDIETILNKINSFNENNQSDDDIKKIYEAVLNNVSNNKKYFFSNYSNLINKIIDTQTLNSNIVNKYLKNLKGIEIGGSSNADYGIDVIHVDRIDLHSMKEDHKYKNFQIEDAGYIQKADIISNGDDLPFKDNTVDFVFVSHVFEHFYDPIKALKEWYRVVKKGGYILLIVPNKERMFDKYRERTTLNELIKRHSGELKTDDMYEDKHHNVWITEDVIEICKYLNFNVIEYEEYNNAVDNSFSVVIQK
ncbi:methyltransferase domain-containing protein [Brachyspira hyodysenteriae]|uniref:class I SAM-dependent methyltransferase n=1 Tax=Brachyspira hyodysenteriae TaxID=159 RepID=UPI002B25F93D|nr:class I SAM-dependent methyltransferase [Brachyspira hyodysenteriae]WPC23750.1 methyltransferase domain-containing protein [Brachyspira hyodysenteriae]